MITQLFKEYFYQNMNASLNVAICNIFATCKYSCQNLFYILVDIHNADEFMLTQKDIKINNFYL